MSRYYAFKDETERGGEEAAVGQHRQHPHHHNDLRVQTDGDNGAVLAELPQFHDPKLEPVLDAPRVERARSTDPEETGEDTHFDDLVSVDLVGQPLPQQYERSHRRSRTGNGDTGHHTRESSLSSPVSCSSLSHSPIHAATTHIHTNTQHHGPPELHGAALAASHSIGKRAENRAATTSGGQVREEEGRSATRVFAVKAGLVGGIGGLLSGYEMTILSAALPGISRKFGSLLDEEEALGSALLVGALCGSFSGGWVSDHVGRWRAVVLTAFIFITGSIMGGVAQSYGVLLWARFAVGVGVAWSAVANLTLLTEVSPSEHRGAVVSAYELMFSLGVLVSYAVGLVLDEVPGGWRAMLWATSVFAAAGIVCMYVWMPESPAWLVHSRQAPSDALNALQTVYAHDARRAEEELERLRAAHGSTTDTAPTGTFKAYTHQILIAAGLMASQELMGTAGVMTFAPLMLQHVGMTRKAAQVAMVIMCTFKPVATLMTITTFHTSLNAPRRTYLIWGGIYMGASLLLCSFAFSMIMGSKALLFAGVSSFLCWHSYSFGPVIRLIASELFPVAVRGRALGITTVATWACALLVVRTFVPTMDILGLRDGFLLFAAMCVVASAYVYLGVPETASKTPEDRRPRTQPLHLQSHCVSNGGHHRG